MTLSTKTVGEGDLRAVFLHGLFGRGKNFTTAAKAIADTHTSTLVDLPNQGDSAWTDTFSYVDMADQVADTLRAGAAADGPVDLIGHSMGGKTAMVLALRHPDLIDRLVVVDISPVASDNGGEFDHLLGSLKALDLETLESRTDADQQLQERIPMRAPAASFCRTCAPPQTATHGSPTWICCTDRCDRSATSRTLPVRPSTGPPSGWAARSPPTLRMKRNPGCASSSPAAAA
ncbi:alpha/beta fold hydrolase [Brevibacterium luteolum]|uniref:alpha/beta fold hydrolase n=1 Tax=Brevibacterium luteolum TaxID=199591 RepID=UPI00215579E3|nr:alpha/beta fold hydrolase [Brevibacterium luteolum]